MDKLTDYQRAVLAAIHNAPWIEPDKQTLPVQEAIASLREKRLLRASCLKHGALESSEAGAKLLGYA